MAPYFPFHPPEKLTSDEGHYATVTKVEKGRFEGKWELRIDRPGQKPKIFHTTPTYGAVRTKMAKFLDLPLSSITLHIGDPNSQSPGAQKDQNMPSTPTASNTTRNAKIPTSFSTEYGQHGTITPTGKDWSFQIEGPMALFGGSASRGYVSGTSKPSEHSVALIASNLLEVSEDSIKFHYEATDASNKTKKPSPSTPTNKPLDKFEFSPNSRATCHQCHEHISKNSERVGIQEWNARYKHWQPAYYHKTCCTGDMLDSLELGGKRKRDDEDSTAATNNISSVEKKLKAELKRQDEQETSKRLLVFGERMTLRQDLRRLRMEFANQLEVEPYKVFDDATLDDIVAKLPSTEKELIKCRGIAQKRCDRYGGAILQLISQYQGTSHQEDVLYDDDGISSDDDSTLSEDDY